MVKISAQSEHFSVLVLKVGHSKFWLFKPIFRHLDPDSEYGSGFRIPAQIECGWYSFVINGFMRIRKFIGIGGGTRYRT